MLTIERMTFGYRARYGDLPWACTACPIRAAALALELELTRLHMQLSDA